MRISIDGGGLCTNKDSRFGNYIFSQNLIQALNLYDKVNHYAIYSFCTKPQGLKLNQNFDYRRLFPKKLWMLLAVSLQERTTKQDIFLALNQAVPKTEAKVISFSHGLSFYYYQELYPDLYSKLMKQLSAMNKKSRHIIVSSVKVKKELESLFGNKSKIIVIPFGIAFDLLTSVKRKRKKHFLYVGMNHPIKNLKFLDQAFREFKKDNKFKEYELIKLEKSTVSRQKLKLLYQEAAGYLTSSKYESFNLPVLEALSQNCPVIGLRSAIIPEFTDYVSLANNLPEFVKLMKEIASGNYRSINRSKLRKEFSWRSYVQKLVKLY